MVDERRFYEASHSGVRRSAPAVLRNREPIALVLDDWLPPSGLVLEIASGTGEHAMFFAERFPLLDWQPSDVHSDALSSIAAWRESADLSNLRPPIRLDAAAPDWRVDRTDHSPGEDKPRAGFSTEEPHASSGPYDAVLCVNMIHISPWSAALGLLEGSAKVLRAGGALILYGPWLKADIATAPSNVEFDRQLRDRDPEWGLRKVEDFEVEAGRRGFALDEVRTMPANNLMLLFRFAG